MVIGPKDFEKKAETTVFDLEHNLDIEIMERAPIRSKLRIVYSIQPENELSPEIIGTLLRKYYAKPGIVLTEHSPAKRLIYIDIDPNKK